MDVAMNTNKDIVRKSTPDGLNEEIDVQIKKSLEYFSNRSPSEIKERIEKLDSEWDIERVLELNAGIFALTGVILSVTKNKNWIWLPGIVTTFLIQHAVQGWCPPLPLFRMMKIRTRKEIDKEKYRLIELLKTNKL